MDGLESGIHHVTAMCGDAQANIDFYAGFLGLRLIKVGVNQDDPGTYHFFYGDGLGGFTEGITFFPFKSMPQGAIGRSQVAVVGFAVPEGSLAFWEQRFSTGGIDFKRGRGPFGGPEGLDFTDPDGLRLRLVASENGHSGPVHGFAGLDPAVAVRGFHSVEIWSARPDSSVRVLEALGATVETERGTLLRMTFDAGSASQIVYLETDQSLPLGQPGTGTVHHVAWRVVDDADQAARRAAMVAVGLRPTEVIDRMYFKSVYFREYGGVLYELATNGPGFDVDESAESLGTGLSLPPWLEEQREAILAGVQPILLPGGVHIP